MVTRWRTPGRRGSPEGWLLTGCRWALTKAFPPELVDEVVAATDTRELPRRLLPPRLVALWLFRGRNCGYARVMGKLVDARCITGGGASSSSTARSTRTAGSTPAGAGGAVRRISPRCLVPGPGWVLTRCTCCSTPVQARSAPRGGLVRTAGGVDGRHHQRRLGGLRPGHRPARHPGYPALDLACAYPMRLRAETVIGHHKTDTGAGMPACPDRPDRHRHRHRGLPPHEARSGPRHLPPEDHQPELLRARPPWSRQPTSHQEGRRLPRPQRPAQRSRRHPSIQRKTGASCPAPPVEARQPDGAAGHPSPPCQQCVHAVLPGTSRISPRRRGALTMAPPLDRRTSVRPLPALRRQIPDTSRDAWSSARW